MEYIGLAGAWKSFQGFVLSEDKIFGLIILGVVVAAVVAFNWLVKK